MTLLHRLALLVMGPWWCAMAAANEPVLAPGPVDRCLVVGEGLPDYPFTPFKRNESGRVLVELSFTTPDLRPAVKVLQQEGDDSFVDAVKAHVRHYRLPCLGEGDVPAVLRRDFIFKPDQRTVRWVDQADEAALRRSAQLSCWQHVSGKRAPEYPWRAERANVFGNVLVQLRFVSPDGEPQVTVHAPENVDMLAGASHDWARGLRLPCLHDGPIDVVWTMQYRFEGDPAFGFKPMAFRNYLANIQGITEQRVQFDTTTMNCPFDVRVQYRQPFMPNHVGDVGTHNPARRPLLHWLAAQQLTLTRAQHRAVFADTVTLTIPCIRLNLNAKE